MPRRSFHRSQSEALPPSEHAYRRAARELRAFHRARSLDVILEEDHTTDNAGTSASASGEGLKKKRAVLCLADLVVDEHDHDVHHDASENTTEEGADLEGSEQQQGFLIAGADKDQWGHFTVDSPSDHHQDPHRSSTPILRGVPYHPAAKPRTLRRFERS